MWMASERYCRTKIIFFIHFQLPGAQHDKADFDTPSYASTQSTLSKRPKRRVELYRILYAHIMHALIVQTIPFELLRKPPTAKRWDPTLGTPKWRHILQSISSPV